MGLIHASGRSQEESRTLNTLHRMPVLSPLAWRLELSLPRAPCGSHTAAAHGPLPGPRGGPPCCVDTLRRHVSGCVSQACGTQAVVPVPCHLETQYRNGVCVFSTAVSDVVVDPTVFVLSAVVQCGVSSGTWSLDSLSSVCLGFRDDAVSSGQVPHRCAHRWVVSF